MGDIVGKPTHLGETYKTTRVGERGSLRVPAIRRKGTMRSGTATLLTDESRAPIPEHKTPLAMTRGEKENLREGNF